MRKVDRLTRKCGAVIRDAARQRAVPSASLNSAGVQTSVWPYIASRAQVRSRINLVEVIEVGAPTIEQHVKHTAIGHENVRLRRGLAHVEGRRQVARAGIGDHDDVRAIVGIRSARVEAIRNCAR